MPASERCGGRVRGLVWWQGDPAAAAAAGAAAAPCPCRSGSPRCPRPTWLTLAAGMDPQNMPGAPLSSGDTLVAPLAGVVMVAVMVVAGAGVPPVAAEQVP